MKTEETTATTPTTTPETPATTYPTQWASSMFLTLLDNLSRIKLSRRSQLSNNKPRKGSQIYFHFLSF